MDKYEAHKMVSFFEKKKLINRRNVCERCGCLGRTIFHHPDYSRPILVIEVCDSCHQQIHKKKGRDSPIYGRKHTEESRAKMRKNNRCNSNNR